MRPKRTIRREKRTPMITVKRQWDAKRLARAERKAQR